MKKFFLSLLLCIGSIGGMEWGNEGEYVVRWGGRGMPKRFEVVRVKTPKLPYPFASLERKKDGKMEWGAIICPCTTKELAERGFIQKGNEIELAK